MTQQQRVERTIRESIRSLGAYAVADAGKLIKLDAMENPYPWPETLRDPWLAALREVPINRYPDPRARQLQQPLRQAMGIPTGMGMLLGNGSDELIQLLALAVDGPKRTLLAPEPGFVMYRMIATFAGLDYCGVPLQADFSLDLPAMLAAIEAEQPALIFLAWPNNPTGNLFAVSDIEAILAAAPGLVVIDEAYHAFAEQSFMPRLAEFENLLVMRTLSKLGLAGLRLGLLAGANAWIEQLDKVRLPYNINALTQATTAFVLSHDDVLMAQSAKIREQRQQLQSALAELPGIEPYPSAANFILFRVPAGSADKIFWGLQSRGVLIKNMSHAGEALRDCLRVTVGRADENVAFLNALRAALGDLEA